MRLPTERQAFAFLEPLRGRSAIITVQDREANLSVAAFVAVCLASSKARTTLFDTSAFLAGNMPTLARQLPAAFLQQTEMIVPSEEKEIERSLEALVRVEASALFVDDLNALLYLMSPTGQKSGVHHLSNLLHVLAYAARVNRSFLMATVYDQDVSPQSTRSLSNLAELQISVTTDRSSILTFECADIGWPGNQFTAYFAVST